MGEKSCSGRNEDLETHKSDRAVWLMKCPPLVSRSWLPDVAETTTTTTASESSSSSSPLPRHLAKVVLSIDPLQSNDDNSLPQFTMELAGNDFGNAPKLYTMDMSKDLIPMCVFSQTNEGKLSVEGKVLNKFDMKPHNENIGDYSKLCRERTQKYMIKTRQTQPYTNDNGIHMRPMAIASSFATTSKDKKKPVPTKGSETKRTRKERGEMETIMFKLFEGQANWTLKNLINETNQPEQFLKDILKDLCVYNNKGTNQGTYELKPEYKKSTEDTSSK